ncbi:hypothetical protein [Paraburkholderia graminis]|uniref:hypothetical protein n=1 Tax=Paraburkholderia graminis TaxID=60548 RepID=UPI0031E01741
MIRIFKEPPFYFVFASLFLLGCETEHQNPLASYEKRSGDFCDRVRYILIQGTSGYSSQRQFSDIRGRRLEGEGTYQGKVLLPGASRCEIESIIYSQAEYKCYFRDAPESQTGQLMMELRKLESELDSCLVQTPWPSLRLNTSVDPNIRYRKYVSSENEIDYRDRWSHQTVLLDQEDIGGGRANVVTIRGR